MQNMLTNVFFPQLPDTSSILSIRKHFNWFPVLALIHVDTIHTEGKKKNQQKLVELHKLSISKIKH